MFVDDEISKVFLYKNIFYINNDSELNILTTAGYIQCPAPLLTPPSQNNLNTVHDEFMYNVYEVVNTDVVFIDFANPINNNNPSE